MDYSIDVSVMSEDEARNVLIPRSRLQRPTGSSQGGADAAEVVRVLDCLPLALD